VAPGRILENGLVLVSHGAIRAVGIEYDVFPFELSVAKAQAVRDSLCSGKLRAVLFHGSFPYRTRRAKPSEKSELTQALDLDAFEA
jgi:hypothetical protein